MTDNRPAVQVAVYRCFCIRRHLGASTAEVRRQRAARSRCARILGMSLQPAACDYRNFAARSSYSYSGEWVAVAVAEEASVGIDIESPSPAVLRSARRWVCPGARDEFEAAEGWTLREAAWKAAPWDVTPLRGAPALAPRTWTGWVQDKPLPVALAVASSSVDDPRLQRGCCISSTVDAAPHIELEVRPWSW